MMRSLFALLVIAGSFTLHASPIAGRICSDGTLAEFIALGDTGCYMVHGERIYDISVDLPTPADLSTFRFAVSDVRTSGYSEVAARFFPAGSILTVHFQSPSPGATGDWYQFNAGGNLASSPFDFDTGNSEDCMITMRASLPDAYLGFRITQVVAPEPSARWLMLGIGLLMIARRIRDIVADIRSHGVRNSSSR